MTISLTPEKRAEVVEAMARATFIRNNGMATCWAWDEGGLDDEHPGARERYLNDAQAALDAALPLIAGAVLERAAQKADDMAADAAKNAAGLSRANSISWWALYDWYLSSARFIRALAGDAA